MAVEMSKRDGDALASAGTRRNMTDVAGDKTGIEIAENFSGYVALDC